MEELTYRISRLLAVCAIATWILILLGMINYSTSSVNVFPYLWGRLMDSLSRGDLSTIWMVFSVPLIYAYNWLIFGKLTFWLVKKSQVEDE